jgi:parvulin-like peptidyl-prolyl isomerase
LRRMVLVPATLFGLAFFASCGLPGGVRRYLQRKAPGVTAVQVGSNRYTRADLDAFITANLGEFREPQNQNAVESSLLDAFVEDRLLAAEADRLGIQPGAQAVKAMVMRISASETGSHADEPDLEKAIFASLKAQKYVRDYLLKDVTATDEDCELYYKEHLGEYVRNDTVHLSEILVDDQRTAQKLLAMLKTKQNKNFSDLARVYSKGSTAAEGGDLGSFQRGDLPGEFEKAVFSLSPGSLSRLVPTRYGYHIFLLHEKILAHQQKFMEVRDLIRDKLLADRQRNMIAAELESLSKRIPVVIYRDRLGFDYTGNRPTAAGGSVQ